MQPSRAFHNNNLSKIIGDKGAETERVIGNWKIAYTENPNYGALKARVTKAEY